MKELVFLLLALSFGWWCGHATARVRVIVLGATEQDDETAIDQLTPEEEQQIDEWRDQLDKALNRFDSRGDAP